MTSLAVLLTAERVADVADPARAVRLAQQLSVWQGGAARHQAAADSAGGAVRIYRQLAEAKPAVFAPELALTLTSRGLACSRSGQRDAAVDALAEAVRLYRELIGPDTPLRLLALRPLTSLTLRVGLAVALTNLALARCDLGQHGWAVAAAEESVHILSRLRARNHLYRAMARSDPAAFEHGTASALSNLGVVLAEQGQLDRACTLAEQTVGVYRRLARVDRSYRPQLARALHNFGLASSELGRHEVALAVTDEAVTLHRRFTAADPDAAAPHLARALAAFAKVRGAAGSDLRAGLAAGQEAVCRTERLAEAAPSAFSGDLCDAYRSVTEVRRALTRLQAGDN